MATAGEAKLFPGESRGQRVTMRDLFYDALGTGFRRDDEKREPR